MKQYFSIIIGLASILTACGGGGGGAGPQPAVTFTTQNYQTVSKISSVNEENTIPLFNNTNVPSNSVDSHVIVYGNFFGDNSSARMTHTFEYDYTAATANNLGHIQFWKLSTDGTWVDKTSEILTDNVGCLHARKAIVADFTNNNKPSIFISCSGVDANPNPGEKSIYLKMGNDGKFTKNMIDDTAAAYAHGATSLDVNNDGFADVVVADMKDSRKFYFLINNAGAGFTKDTSATPQYLISLPGNSDALFSIETADFNKDGFYDIWAAGHNNTSFLLINDGNNNFTTKIDVPAPVVSTNDVGLDIDFDKNTNYIYVTKTTSASGQAFYSTAYIQKIYFDGTSFSQNATLYESSVALGTTSMKWINWIYISGNYIKSIMGNLAINIAK